MNPKDIEWNPIKLGDFVLAKKEPYSELSPGMVVSMSDKKNYPQDTYGGERLLMLAMRLLGLPSILPLMMAKRYFGHNMIIESYLCHT